MEAHSVLFFLLCFLAFTVTLVTSAQVYGVGPPRAFPCFSKPTGDTRKSIKVGVLLPVPPLYGNVYLGDIRDSWSLKLGSQAVDDGFSTSWRMIASALVAAHHINNRSDILTDYFIEPIIRLASVSESGSILAFQSIFEDNYGPFQPPGWGSADLHTQMVVGFPFPELSQGGVGLSTAFAVPTLSAFVDQTLFNEAPLFNSLVMNLMQEAKALTFLFKNLGWKNCVILAGTDARSTKLSSLFEEQARMEGITVRQVHLISYSYRDQFENGFKDTPSVQRALQSIANSIYRVIVIMTPPDLAVSLFCEGGCCPAETISACKARLAAQGRERMDKEPYIWVPTAHILSADWDGGSESFNATTAASTSAGLVGSAYYVERTSDLYRNYSQSWQALYAQDKSCTFGQNRSTSADLMYVTMLFAAQALDKLYMTLDFCSDVVVNATVRTLVTSTLQQNLTSNLGNFQVGCDLPIPAHLDTYNTTMCCTYERFRRERELEAARLTLNYVIRSMNKTSSILGDISVDANGSSTLPIFFRGQGEGAVGSDIIFGQYDESHPEDAVVHSHAIYWGRYAPRQSQRHPVTGAPLDSLQARVSQRPAYLGWAVTLVVVGGVIMLYGGVLGVLTFKHRAVPAIKMSSPNINFLLLFGCILWITSPIIRAIAMFSNDAFFRAVCLYNSWCYPIGSTLVFGALFAKTYRVHQLFNSNRLTRSVYHDKYLFLFVFVLVLVDLAALALATGLSTSAIVDRVDIASNQNFPMNQYTFLQTRACRDDVLNESVTALYGTYKFLFAAFGIWLAWQTRNVPVASMTDSRDIGISMFIMFLYTLEVALAKGMTDDPDRIAFIEIGGMYFSSSVIMSLVFTRKLSAIYFPDAAHKRTTIQLAKLKHENNMLQARNRQLSQQIQISERGSVNKSGSEEKGRSRRPSHDLPPFQRRNSSSVLSVPSIIRSPVGISRQCPSIACVISPANTPCNSQMTPDDRKDHASESDSSDIVMRRRGQNVEKSPLSGTAKGSSHDHDHELELAIERELEEMARPEISDIRPAALSPRSITGSLPGTPIANHRSMRPSSPNSIVLSRFSISSRNSPSFTRKSSSPSPNTMLHHPASHSPGQYTRKNIQE